MASAAPRVVEAAEELTRLCAGQQRTDPVETITGELIPLCAALRFIGQQGPGILRDTSYGWSGRPAWLWGVRSCVQRRPLGRVLIVGTWNYPILLAGVQAAQALAAGNRVFLKPAVGVESVTERLVQTFHDAGVPAGLLRQLDSPPEAAMRAIDEGVELIVLTGAAATGRKVLRYAADSLTPTIMELSGCDAVVVLEDANLQRVADAVAFGMRFNGGATCIGPRRIIATATIADRLIELLASRLDSSPPITVRAEARTGTAAAVQQALAEGAVVCRGQFDADRLRDSGQMTPLLLDRVRPESPIAAADLFAPLASVIRVATTESALQVVNDCPYRLAASVFGSRARAEAVAERLDVGFVCIDDCIVPTADPRLPFGGRGSSGFGVTRGVEGLLAMTSPRVISRRRGNFTPHFRDRSPSDAQTLLGTLQMLYGGSWRQRLGGLRQMSVAGRRAAAAPPRDQT